MNINTISTVGILVGLAYALHNYHPEEPKVEATSTNRLPYQSEPEPDRWRHDGSQMLGEQSGNHFYGSTSAGDVVSSLLHTV